MTFLAVVGAVALALPPLWFGFVLLEYYSMSDYGFWDTTKWNFYRNGVNLWIPWALFISLSLLWWAFIGSRITIGFN